ncbi:SDR family NAD(P)-dependent oxidoreductase [Actinomadura parmotrematis]|uniref:SDR family oxidoreductase n=1 Tax=Actinomadura parmotrematis TaxID=2864039 RepID=A0ABS7FYA1_9ACTN|nr:SDR family oxidoreductase [Actinomadura parmotrematis]MBW8484644.1 SDR family oxidoreductase [Actinomadura parmotrematis]
MTGARTALVTGAGSGLGALAAQRLAAAGWDVVALDVDEPGLAATARRSPTLHTRACDVTDPDAVAAVAAEAGPLQRVVHAAAISPLVPALDQPVEDVHRVLHINFLGTVHVVRAALPAMLDAGRGEIVLFSSLASLVPGRLTSAYAAAKAAVNAYAESLLIEYGGRGVTFRVVVPAQVDTPMYRRQAAAHPKATAGMKGMDPGAVLDAVDRSLARPEGDLYVYPGTVARLTAATKRHFPTLMRRVLDKQTS